MSTNPNDARSRIAERLNVASRADHAEQGMAYLLETLTRVELLAHDTATLLREVSQQQKEILAEQRKPVTKTAVGMFPDGRKIELTVTEKR